MAEIPTDTPLVAQDLDSSCVSCEDKAEGLQRLPCLHSVSVCEKQECREKLAKSKVSCSECKEVFDVPEVGFPSYSFATKCSHHGQSLQLYCVPCEILVCQLCKADGIHKSHDVLSVSEELVVKNKRTLTACISEVNGEMETLDARMKEIDEKQVTLDRHFTDAKEEVNRMIEELISQLRTRRDSLISELEQKNMIGINNLNEYKGEFQSHHSKLAAYKAKMEKVVESASRIELISMSQIAVKRLELLIEMTSQPTPPLPSIHFVDSRNKQQAKDSVEVLGSIESVSPPNCSMSGVAVSDNVIRYTPWSVPFSFKVFTRDHSGSHCVFGGENVRAVLTPTTCGVPVLGQVEDNRDGTYQVEFKCVPSNQSELVVTVNDEHIKGSPVKMEIGYPTAIKQIIKDPKKKNRRFRALSFTKGGLLLATDGKNKNVCIWNEDGELVRTFKVSSGGDHMHGITELSDGNIAVSLSDKNRIAVYTPEGEFVRDFGSDRLKMPCGIAVNNGGQLFVAENNGNRLSVYSEDGRFQSSFGSKGSKDGEFNHPEQVCIAQDGLVYVSDRYNNRIQVFEQGGSFVHQFGNDLLSAPTGLAFTKDDHVVVVTSSQWSTNKLIIFTKSKECVLQSTDLGLYYPYGVAVSEGGIIYIADPDNNRIVKV